MFPFLTLTDIPMECNIKSNFPPNFSVDCSTKDSKSSVFVASAGIISDPVFLLVH